MTRRLRTLAPAALVLASLLVPTAARAQAVGIHGGVAASQFSYETVERATSNLLGGTGGVFVLLGEGTFGGIVEANWIRKGTKAAGGTEVKVDYLEIPLAARLVFGSDEEISLHAIFGGTIAFKLNTSQSGPPLIEDLDADIGGFDHGILVGAGLEFRNLILSARYNWGTRDVSDRPAEFYNRGWTFLIGYKLLGGR